MMIYQQTMLSSTIEPVSFSSHRSSSLSLSFIEKRKISSSSSSSSQEQEQVQEFQDQQEQVRFVNFSSCTKKQEKQAASDAKRMNSSRSVPIPECMFRTPSELQLTFDEQVAEQRDFAFFTRLVSGISERRASSTSATIEIDRCLTHIMQTRHHTQSHDDQEAEEAHCCDGILIEDDYQVRTGEEGEYYYLGEDNDCFTTSSSSSSSSSSSTSSILYQHEFVDYEEQKAVHSSNDDHDDLYNEGGDCDCMFDLEL